MDRYGSGEEEFEPGSQGRVLRNKLGITDPREEEILESQLLFEAQLRSYEELGVDRRLSTELLQEMHRDWLQSLYPFAGAIRKIDLSKGFVRFAPVAYLPATLRELDKALNDLYPINGNRVDLVTALATAHCEIVLAHPFRDGNGRLARWATDILALQAGAFVLDWSFAARSAAGRESYFAALRRGFAGDLEPLAAHLRAALEQ